jgi:hypothetical protein
MSDASALLQLIAVVGLFIAVGAVCAAPMLLAGWADDRRYKFEHELIRQSEIARKVAIAEAAIEARKLGETFVPPDDYAR